jgi:hypothetical protein
VVTTPIVSWADHNALNSGCMWVNDYEPFVLNQCEMRRPVNIGRDFAAQPPPPPPPPPPPKH